MNELEEKLLKKIKADLEKSSVAVNDAIAKSIREALNPTTREMGGLLTMMEKGSFEDKRKALVWTATTDMLPEFDTRVLAVSIGGEIVISKIVAEDGELCWKDDDQGTFGLDTVTHWTKLPLKPITP